MIWAQSYQGATIVLLCTQCTCADMNWASAFRLLTYLATTYLSPVYNGPWPQHMLFKNLIFVQSTQLWSSCDNIVNLCLIFHQSYQIPYKLVTSFFTNFSFPHSFTIPLIPVHVPCTCKLWGQCRRERSRCALCTQHNSPSQQLSVQEVDVAYRRKFT